jgi:hypothetical protein
VVVVSLRKKLRCEGKKWRGCSRVKILRAKKRKKNIQNVTSGG